MNEKDLKAKIKDDLRRRYPQAWIFSPVQMGMGQSGVPDILACVEGRLWAIEAKMKGCKPTALQIKQLLAIKNAGGWALIATQTEGLRYELEEI